MTGPENHKKYDVNSQDRPFRRGSVCTLPTPSGLAGFCSQDFMKRLNIDPKTHVNLARAPAAANPPVLHGRFMKHDDDIVSGNSRGFF